MMKSTKFLHLEILEDRIVPFALWVPWPDAHLLKLGYLPGADSYDYGLTVMNAPPSKYPATSNYPVDHTPMKKQVKDPKVRMEDAFGRYQSSQSKPASKKMKSKHSILQSTKLSKPRKRNDSWRIVFELDSKI